MNRTLLPTACAFFFLAGLAIIPLAGIQADEALFSAPIYESAYRYSISVVFGNKIPLMLMSYLGTLKTWIYWVIFQIAWPSVWSLRLPMLAVGTLTLWLFWRLAERLGGLRAAIIGTFLLATDAMFLITIVLDWGPVALQHLLLISGMLLVLRFHDSGSRRALFGAFLMFGLGVWDKALFLWLLGGLVAASLVVVPGELRRALNRRTLPIAALAFCLGAGPVIWHNLKSPGETMRSNAVFTSRELGPKAVSLWRTLAGGALLGYIAREAWPDPPLPPKTALQKASVWVSEAAGEPRSSLFPWLVLLAAVCVPLVWHTRARRPALFSLVFLAVAWFQMAITQHAGGSAHHIVLLWPVPHLLVAVVCAELSRRWRRAGVSIVALAAVLGCGSNLLVLNQYHSQLVRYGAPPMWSDAVLGLSKRLQQMEAEHIFMMDWGLIDNVRMLTRGRLPIHNGLDAVDKEPPTPANRELFGQMIGLPNPVFVSFIEKSEQIPGVHRHIMTLAAEAGHRVEVVELVTDSNGRAVFQILRIVHVPSPVQ